MILFDAIVNHPDRVEELLKDGVDVNIKVTSVYRIQCSRRSSIVLYAGITPLHVACEYEPSVVPILLEYGADMNPRADMGHTPLHRACIHQPSLVPILLKQGAHTSTKNEWGRTPLHLVCIFHPFLIPELIQHGADVNIRDHYGDLPIHFCRDKEFRLLYKLTETIKGRSPPRVPFRFYNRLYAGMIWNRIPGVPSSFVLLEFM